MYVCIYVYILCIYGLCVFFFLLLFSFLWFPELMWWNCSDVKRFLLFIEIFIFTTSLYLNHTYTTYIIYTNSICWVSYSLSPCEHCFRVRSTKLFFSAQGVCNQRQVLQVRLTLAPSCSKKHWFEEWYLRKIRKLTFQ